MKKPERMQEIANQMLQYFHENKTSEYGAKLLSCHSNFRPKLDEDDNCQIAGNSPGAKLPNMIVSGRGRSRCHVDIFDFEGRFILLPCISRVTIQYSIVTFIYFNFSF